MLLVLNIRGQKVVEAWRAKIRNVQRLARMGNLGKLVVKALDQPSIGQN